MANEFPVPPERLKRLIKQSLLMPIPFGFNPGIAGDGDEYLAAHPRRPPELMGRIAQHEGAGMKTAFGSFALSDRELHLTCFRVIPQLAKRFKRFLKSGNIKLNVVVMDEAGEIVESDIEDLVDAFDAAALDEDGAADETPAAEAPAAMPAGAPAAAPAAGGAPAPQPQRTRSIDPSVAALAGLSDRLKRLQPQVAAAPGPVAQKLGALFKSAIVLVREGKTKEGGAAIAALEATFAKIGKAPGGAAPAPAAAAPARDPRLPKLRDALIKLEDRAERLLGNGADVVLGDLEPLAAQIDLGEADAVFAALREAQTRIAAIAAARAKWDRISKRLAPKVEAAVGGSGTAQLKMRWKFVSGLAEVGDWHRALASVPGLVALLRETAAAQAPDPAQVDALMQAALEAAQGPDRAALAEVAGQLEPIFAALQGSSDPAERRALREKAAGLVAGARAAREAA